MDTPLTLGGIIAAVIIPLVGVLIWVIKHILERTIPEMAERHHDFITTQRKEFLETLEGATKTFSEQLKDTRDFYCAQIQRERELFQADQKEIVAELRRVSTVLQTHEELLTKVINLIRRDEASDLRPKNG